MKHSEKFAALAEASKNQIKEIDVATVKQKIDNQENFYLIDVREASEWTNGHLPKALHLSKGIIERDIEKIIPDTNAEIILYCGGGYRSALAADNLQKMGYNHIFSMAGGFRAWLAANYKIEM